MEWELDKEDRMGYNAAPLEGRDWRAGSVYGENADEDDPTTSSQGRGGRR